MGRWVHDGRATHDEVNLIFGAVVRVGDPTQVPKVVDPDTEFGVMVCAGCDELRALQSETGLCVSCSRPPPTKLRLDVVSTQSP